MLKIAFQSPSDESIEIPDIINKIKNFLEEDENAYYTLTIGSDSEAKSANKKNILEVITAIVIYRKGYGGRYFWYRRKTPPVHTLRDKIYQEVMQSIEIAKLFVPDLKVKLNGHSKYDLEIHIDVGEKGETREMIKEVVGLVTGIGFVAKTKPASYAASNIADRHV